MRRVKVPLDEGAVIQPGDFAFDFDSKETGGDRAVEVHHMYICLPGGGDSGWAAIQCRKGSPGGERVWGWDGNEDRPTLTPSVHWPGVWHGWCRAGRLESC